MQSRVQICRSRYGGKGYIHRGLHGVRWSGRPRKCELCDLCPRMPCCCACDQRCTLPFLATCSCYAVLHTCEHLERNWTANTAPVMCILRGFVVMAFGFIPLGPHCFLQLSGC